MAYKCKTGGFLYWMLDEWTPFRKIITTGPYTDWAMSSPTGTHVGKQVGDGDLMCAGPDGPVSTIRLENIRDGLEDYEYLYVLKQKVDAIRKGPQSMQTRAFIEEAESLLAIPDSLVRSATEFNYDPWELASFRRKLAEAILEADKYVSN